MENQHRHIMGFRDFERSTVDHINNIKSLEQAITENLEATAEELRKSYNPEAVRHLSLARTALEEGFMWWIKSIAQPTSGLANAKLHGSYKPENVGVQKPSSHGIGINNPGV